MRLFIAGILLLSTWSLLWAKPIDMETAIKMAIKHNPEIASQKALIKASTYRKKALKSSKLLYTELGASYERNSDPVAVVPIKGPGAFPDFSKDIYSWAISIKLPIYQGGRITHLVKAEEAQKNMRKYLLKQTLQDLIANVKELFLRGIYLKELEKAYQSSIKDLEEITKRASLMYKLGKVPYLDLLYFKSILEEEKAQLESVREEYRLTTKLLEILTGCPSPEPIGKLKEEPFAHYTMPQTVERPDIKAAVYQVEKAKNMVEKAKREFYPTIELHSSYGERAGAGLNNGEEVWNIRIGIKIPLFDSGFRLNTLREKRYQYQSALMHLEWVKLQAQKEIESSISGIKRAKLAIEKLKSSLEFSKEAYIREKVKYETHAGSVMDLLQSHRNFLKAQIALKNAIYQLNQAIVAYELASGNIDRGFEQ